MTLWVATGWVLLVALSAITATLIWQMWTGRIDLRRLISEPNGDASMSRFQLLVFTLVVAFALFIIVVSGDKPTFPEAIPPSVLTLLGISASSYLVSKGIQFSSNQGSRHVNPDAADEDAADDAEANADANADDDADDDADANAGAPTKPGTAGGNRRGG
jgi:phosphoglycerol transferase MdoB-like AlkP superfamily enzyme